MIIQALTITYICNTHTHTLSNWPADTRWISDNLKTLISCLVRPVRKYNMGHHKGISNDAMKPVGWHPTPNTNIKNLWHHHRSQFIWISFLLELFGVSWSINQNIATTHVVHTLQLQYGEIHTQWTWNGNVLMTCDTQTHICTRTIWHARSISKGTSQDGARTDKHLLFITFLIAFVMSLRICEKRNRYILIEDGNIPVVRYEWPGQRFNLKKTLLFPNTST